MENPFKHVSFEPIPSESSGIPRAQKIIGTLEVSFAKENAINAEERKEAREVIRDLEELQLNVEVSPESEVVLAEIRVALTKLRNMLHISEA